MPLAQVCGQDILRAQALLSVRGGALVDFIDNTMKAGGSVAIHCRAGTFAAATAQSQGHSPADALDAVSAAVDLFKYATWGLERLRCNPSAASLRQILIRTIEMYVLTEWNETQCTMLF